MIVEVAEEIISKYFCYNRLVCLSVIHATCATNDISENKFIYLGVKLRCLKCISFFIYMSVGNFIVVIVEFSFKID